MKKRLVKIFTFILIFALTTACSPSGGNSDVSTDNSSQSEVTDSTTDSTEETEEQENNGSLISSKLAVELCDKKDFDDKSVLVVQPFQSHEFALTFPKEEVADLSTGNIYLLNIKAKDESIADLDEDDAKYLEGLYSVVAVNPLIKVDGYVEIQGLGLDYPENIYVNPNVKKTDTSDEYENLKIDIQFPTTILKVYPDINANPPETFYTLVDNGADSFIVESDTEYDIGDKVIVKAEGTVSNDLALDFYLKHKEMVDDFPLGSLLALYKEDLDVEVVEDTGDNSTEVRDLELE